MLNLVYLIGGPVQGVHTSLIVKKLSAPIVSLRTLFLFKMVEKSYGGRVYPCYALQT